MNTEFVRFRADPRKVRVTIRKKNFGNISGWSARVCARHAENEREFFSDDPRLAVQAALEHAGREGVAGVDLGLQWAYGHPWRRGP